MVYLRARHYDPSAGRFLQQDSYAGTLTDPASQHRYGYGRGNPLRYSDPSGHDPWYRAGEDPGSTAFAEAFTACVAAMDARMCADYGATLDWYSVQRGKGGAIDDTDPIDVIKRGSPVDWVICAATMFLGGPRTAARLTARLTQKGVDHVVFRHWFSAGFANVSKFAATIGLKELKDLVAEVTTHSSASWIKQGSRWVVEVDLGRIIGTDATGAATSRIRIVLEGSGEVVSAYPIPR